MMQAQILLVLISQAQVGTVLDETWIYLLSSSHLVKSRDSISSFEHDNPQSNRLSSGVWYNTWLQGDGLPAAELGGVCTS